MINKAGDREGLKVLYLFDRYLNSTMNWAERWMQHLPGVTLYIAAPLIIKNEYFKQAYKFWTSPYQFDFPVHEKKVGFFQSLISKVSFKTGLFHRFLEKKIKATKPDIIHVFFGNIAVKYLNLIKQFKIPLVVSFLGYDYEMVPRLSGDGVQFYADLFEYGSVFTVGGPSGKAKLMELGCPGEKIKIISLGINPNDIPFATKRKKDGTFKLLQIGTITPKKGHIFTLKAFKIIKDKYPEVQLTIIGEPADNLLVEKLEEFLVLNNISGVKLDFTIKPYEELPKIFAAHDVFLHPSLTPPSKDRETAPVVIMDAQLAGLPVISTYHADIPEIIKDGVTGFLVNEGDYEGLAGAIEHFITMREVDFEKFRKAGRKFIENNFSAKDSGRHLMEIYRQLTI